MNIGANLDKAMVAAGFKSQSALARASGVPQPTVNRILKGIAIAPETSTLKKLADACRVPMSQLLSDAYGSTPTNSHHKVQDVVEIYETTTKIHLTYATDEELTLLSKFRESTLMGKKLILTACDASEKDERRIRSIKKA